MIRIITSPILYDDSVHIFALALRKFKHTHDISRYNLEYGFNKNLLSRERKISFRPPLHFIFHHVNMKENILLHLLGYLGTMCASKISPMFLEVYLWTHLFLFCVKTFRRYIYGIYSYVYLQNNPDTKN